MDWLIGMVFVRIKRISGKEYAYLVANSWTGSGPRQKVSKYLGRLIRPEKAKSEALGAFLGLTGEQALRQWIGKSSFREIAAELIRLELRNHGINDSNSHKTAVENTEFLDDKGKNIVIALNDGFLCSYTAKKLLEYDAATDYSGYNLADALTAAGIAVEKDVFISLFGKMQAKATAAKGGKETAKEAAFKDFYY
ncbi:hypothetical protein HYU16_00425 [Candidatus Woesearchaeota archaeon]|nr:hypothetical protein [Candidatus Woesearchaeota archaeon]